jgi:hypothetical protein
MSQEVENALAIKELTTIAKQTTKDVDKIVLHLDKLIPVHTQLEYLISEVADLKEENKLGVRPKTLKSLLTWGAIVVIAFGSWIEVNHNILKNNLNTHKASQKEREKNIDSELKRQNSLLSRNFEHIKAAERYK